MLHNGSNAAAAEAAIANGTARTDPPGTIDFRARYNIPKENEGPRPLMRLQTAADPFPIDALGPVLANAAKGIQERVRAPIAICASSVLAATNYTVQGHGDVELPNRQVRPISCFFVSIAESGDRKSSTDSEAVWPIYKREAVLREPYESAEAIYELDKLAHEKAKEAALKTHTKGGKAAMRRALDELGPAPTRPLKPVLLVSEPTFEGLFKIYLMGHASLALFSAEGGSFVGGHAMKDEAKIRTGAGLCKFWDGAPIDRVRGGDGDAIIRGRRLACHLMVQPAVSDVLLRDETLADQGLLSRLLVTAPDSLAGSRFWAEPSEGADHAIKYYGGQLLALLERPLPLAPGRPNELAPPVLKMSDEARALWVRFQDHIESQLGQGGALAAIKSRANKMPEQAARLAATLALFEDIDVGHIPADHMRRGIVLAQHYIAEAERLAGVARVGGDLRDAQTVLTWLQKDWEGELISLPDLYQRGPSKISTQAAAAKCVGVLEAHGWLERIPRGAVVNGARRRDAWRIVREVVT